MQASMVSNVQPLSGVIKLLRVAVIILVFLVGFPLYIFSDQTEHYFAWTINPPLMAAFLGAGYWAALAVALLILRERNWLRVRSVAPAALTATTLLLVATLIHLDHFHFNSPEPFARAAAWAWFAVYIAVPPAGLVALFIQRRNAAAASARQSPLPGWMRLILGVQAIIALLLGIVIFLSPQSLIPFWPWPLTPLTARAVGAWFAALAVTLATVLWENDLTRVYAPLAGLVAFATLQLIAVFRYLGTLDWSKPGAWLYGFFMVSVLVASLLGAIDARQSQQAASPG